MKEKILAFLKSKLTGVSESFLSGVADTFSKTVKEEKDIETVFTDGIIETLKFSATQLQIEGDRRATEAQKTALKNFQEKHGLNEDGTPIKKVGRPPKDKDADPDPNEPVWFTAFKKEQQESTETLKAEIEKQKQEKTLASLAEKVSKHEKLKDIPASYLKGRNLIPKSEAEIDQLVASIETDYNGFKQEMAEKGVVISVPPTGGGQQSEKSTIDAYLNEKFPKEPQGKVLIKK
ncbi:MAG TPA: hypothetical protein VI911_06005 [Patescibacteria group bacterium]|nr:hypothetical protein [Patescibacteria group bacterium]